ncbi:MAG: class I SAM-dependent methyltransferase [Candidatus Aenigmarchaeota archaeon]|nr:class I SAM-dependent methyltransferase [Candidatus Aenigmarchaeota archaeon]
MKIIKRILRKNTKPYHHTPLTEPTESELKLFEKYFSSSVAGKTNPRVMIIGASPELRDIVAKMKLRATVVAQNFEIIKRASSLMKRKGKKETWLQGDLTKLPLREKHYDIIISDTVTFADLLKKNYLKRLRELLKKNGSVILRAMVLRKNEKKLETNIKNFFRILDKGNPRGDVFKDYFSIYLLRRKR